MPFSIRPHRRFPAQCSVTYNTCSCLKRPLAYLLGWGSLITLLSLSNGPVYAEWVAIASSQSKDGYYTVYVDPDTIRRKEELVKMWVLFDLKTTQTVAGRLILSIKGQEEYDCDGNSHRVLAVSEFSGNMGGGKEVYSTSDERTWLPVDPESVFHGLWKVACSKK